MKLLRRIGKGIDYVANILTAPPKSYDEQMAEMMESGRVPSHLRYNVPAAFYRGGEDRRLPSESRRSLSDISGVVQLYEEKHGALAAARLAKDHYYGYAWAVKEVEGK